MIVEYHRPKSIPEALSLLARETPLSYPLGGGTVLNRGIDLDIAVVDLQDLNLGTITKVGNLLNVGSTVKLQDLLEYKGLPGDIYTVIQLEATYNTRQMATIAGKMVCTDGRSPLAAALLALDVDFVIHEPGKDAHTMRLGDWLPMRENYRASCLITTIKIPTNAKFAFEYVARTPADQPIICASLTQWSSGRTRLVMGGWGKAPILAMDGTNSDGIEIAGKNACNFAGDEWASDEYRQEMAGILSLRCLDRIQID